MAKEINRAPRAAVCCIRPGLIPLLATLAIALYIGAAALSAQTSPVEPETFLRRQLAFSTSDLATLEEGLIVIKLPKTAETREVAAFAVMRLEVPRDFFVQRMRDIVSFKKKSDNVLQIGKFSNPPRLEDLSGLTLDLEEIDSIRRCREGKCDFKMAARFIERFRKEVDWSAPDYRERVTAITRQMLLEHVVTYLNGGNAALGEYNDKPHRLRLADEFASLLQPAPYMYAYNTEFQKYLHNFPESAPAHVETLVYWSKEKFGLKPVVSLTHMTIYRLSAALDADVLIASKGIYANHYFESSLGLTAFVHGRSPGQPSRTYLMYVNRSRTDTLRGMFAGLKRSLIGGRVRDGAKKNMEAIKGALEAEYRLTSDNRQLPPH